MCSTSAAATNSIARRAASDAAGRNGLIEYPHGEVLVDQSDVDGTQAALTGYGPGLGQATTAMPNFALRSGDRHRPAPVTGLHLQRRVDGHRAPGVTTLRQRRGHGVGLRQRPGGAGSNVLAERCLRPRHSSLDHCRGPSGAMLSDRLYEWDPVGNLLHVHDNKIGQGNAQYDATYSHDSLRRIATATVTVGGATPLAVRYCYDALGNLLLIDGVQPLVLLRHLLGALAIGAGDLRSGDGVIQDYGLGLSQIPGAGLAPTRSPMCSRSAA